MNRIITLGIVFLLGGCNIAGGILIEHDPPERIVVGQNQLFKLVLYAPGGNAERGFSEAWLHHRVHSSFEFTRTKMKRTNADKEKAVFQATIKIESEIEADTFEYFFKSSGVGQELEHQTKGRPWSVPLVL